MIYLDNAATTSVAPEVLEAMQAYLTEEYGNPSAVYTKAAVSREAVDRARTEIAAVIGADPDEIYFTSGGTEADNWALAGCFEANRERGNHIITTKIEHPAVLRTCEYLETRGAEITYLEPDSEGRIDPTEVERAIRKDTILISVMAANNEIGTLEPIREIGEIASARGILFHTDAVQAFGQIPLDVRDMKIDLMSASGHKFHGPKGVGFLYIRKGVKIRSFLHGGEQERGRRAGTLNVPGIVGMGRAASLMRERMEAQSAHERALRDVFISRVEQEIPCVTLNGSRNMRLPNNVNFCVKYLEAESALILLDLKGIAASAGSACASGSLNPSHVLLACGCAYEDAFSSLRFTLSGKTTREEVDAAVDALKEIAQKLRSRNPDYCSAMEQRELIK